MDQIRGLGRVVFAATLLMVGGVLNIIYGIAAIGHSRFFTQNGHYLFGSLRTWGWVAVILGVIELLAAMSLYGGGEFGRLFGIFAGSLAAIGALLEIPAYPLWSLAVFAVSLWIIYGLAIYGSDEADVRIEAYSTTETVAPPPERTVQTH